jgi:flagellar motility protein MotE (MotC chaperone)
MAVTVWMSFELGLLSFGKLEAAEERKPAKEVKTESKLESKPEKETKLELKSESKAEKEAKLVTPPTEEKPVSQHSDETLSEREKQLVEKEEFLKKQSEYYEKVILELKEKLSAQIKMGKQNVAQSESTLKQKTNQLEIEWKSKLEKKDSEIADLQKELSTWKDARAELFRGLYERMESKKAAKILETMDLDLSNKIIAGMKQDKAAEIMSKMMPDKAKLITEKTFSARNLGSQDKVNTSQAAVGLEKSVSSK